ncbi:hypothetical protein GYA27_00885 [candidate division WWE3 bacterium]|uniref:Uncharacterized protein n=1 Tax=candidate division WWE3 bacterium TaxID=2053526 RepID=A0A7X9DKA3_UNCKA|nr:hypothetical protein [candidate division WWE3 bacterium]
MNNDQKSPNDIFNETVIEILKEMYAFFGKGDMSSSLEANLIFDESQRVIKWETLLVNGQGQTAPIELSMKINSISAQLSDLPANYRLASCKFSVQSGGHMDIDPVYR